MNAEAVGALVGPSSLQSARSSHWERFAQAPRPSTADEMWRYSRIDDLDLDRYEPLLVAAPPPSEIPAAAAKIVEAVGSEATVVLCRDGGSPGVLSQGSAALIEPVADGASLAGSQLSVDAFDDLNAALAPHPWKLTARRGTAAGGTVVIIHEVSTPGAAIFPRLSVHVESGCELSVLEVLVGEDLDTVVVPFTELNISDNAHLRYAQVQLLGAKTWQLGHLTSSVGADATLKSMTVALGGSYARVRTDSGLTGQNGDVQLLAAYFGTGTQMHDFRTVQHHRAPRTRSDLLFKGMVGDSSHSVYSGLIRVDKGAGGTNAFQTNRNLVLSPGAHADSVPNLEIEDNDVHCSHASAVGPIDEEQLFYLESRGVPTPIARRLIALGFVSDALSRFPVPGLEGWLRQAFAAKLDSSSDLLEASDVDAASDGGDQR